MKTKQYVSLFIAVAVIQLSVMLYMAWQWENILQTGQRFEWETAPVDPYDAFKGRYIDLGFKENSGLALDNTQFAYGQTAYASIERNDDGKAFISGVSAKPPTDKPYVTVKTTYSTGGKIGVKLPFTRYYLPEGLAAPAEAAYRQHGGKTVIAAVRMKNGYGVIEELYIDGQTLNDYLRDSLSPKP